MTSPEENSKNSQNHKSRGWLWFIFGSGIAMVSVTVGMLLATSLNTTPWMQTNRGSKEMAIFNSDRLTGEGLRFSELTRPVNILVMGMSVLPQDIHNPPPESVNLGYHPQVNSLDGLSDVMLLVRFDPERKKLTLLSIPRDTQIEMEGYGIQKINSANIYGGPALSAQIVSHLLGGVRIDRYVRINVLGVGKLIDALGGVTVYVPKDMKYQDDSQHLYINLKAGKQHLNGDQALQLLRYRNDELGDIGRVQRQQMVMRALMNQTLNPTTMTKIPKILNVIEDYIDTNLTVEELLSLMGFGTQTRHSSMQMLMLPGRFSNNGEFNASYWVPNRDRIATMMAQHFNLESSNQLYAAAPGSLRVAIQDSTGSDRALLRTLIQILQKAGYHNIYMAQSWEEPLSVTRIVAQQGDSNSAELIRNALGFGKVRVESTGNLSSDITIFLGQDWLEQQLFLE
jgi:polyisoprenyl-teichoic acid--peptidoglycan teichoic acid transferase